MSTEKELQNCNPEIWGGLECTFNRVGGYFRDQLRDCGHYTRDDDIERIASLGIRKLRYPLLWEYHQPQENTIIDWTWTAKQLAAIKQQGIIPIAGLLHHGSGPAFTHLMDEKFPEKFASYACKIAERFPELEWYTPINEPLTTARFSGLYGHWYPHHKSEQSFVRMLVNQVKATVLAMQEIRFINPSAKLVQTEDLTFIHSTETLSYQAAYENERRWLTIDLLCGKVNDEHFFYDRLLKLGIDEAELRFLNDNACPPDIVGFNYYITSERYLDDNIEKYPPHLHGGNGFHHYADTEAVRSGKMKGLKNLLKEAWQRYHLPLAITENQLSCSREEQIRWLKKCWNDCKQLIKEGVGIHAFTIWALLGSYDWNSLLTQQNGYYEAGAFQVYKNRLRPTALAKMVKLIAREGTCDHPLLDVPGWWERNGSEKADQRLSHYTCPTPLLIIGRNGTLGKALMQACERRFIPYRSLTRLDLDITNERSVAEIFDHYKPWAVINAAGFVDIDKAEQFPEDCYDVNAKGPGILAAVCQKKGARFVTFSSDMVFGGEKTSPYEEPDNVNPLNIYGASKAQSEKIVAQQCKDALILRTSAFFGPADRYNFAYKLVAALRERTIFETVHDTIVSPTYVPDLADAALDLLADDETGIWHITNEQAMSWSDFAYEIADRAQLSKKGILKRSRQEIGWKALRPSYSALHSKKGIHMPALSSALNRYFEQCQY